MLVNVLLLVAASAAWAVGYLFIGAADRGLPPVTETAAMTLIAALAMLVTVRWILRRPLGGPRRRPWVPAVMALTAIALPNLAVVAAEESVSPDLAAVLGTTVPVLTLLLTMFVTRQARVSPLRLLGAAIAVTGLVVFVGWRDLLGDTAELDGVAVMVAGGAVFALNGLLVSRQTADLDGVVLATWTIGFGGLVLAAMALVVEDPLAVAWTPALVADLAAEGVLGMGLAYLAYYALVSRAGPDFASLYAFLVPPLGLLADIVFLGEELTGEHLAGMATLLVGVGLFSRVRGAPRRRAAEAPPEAGAPRPAS